jgi:hypothetical protein
MQCRADATFNYKALLTQHTLDLRHTRRDDALMRKLVLLLFAACSACSSGAQTEPQSATALNEASAAKAQPATDTLARIQALVGTPSCTGDAQCHTLAIGAKACGGPERYLAWSSAHTSETELRSLGEAYQEERRAANTASGMMSTCSFLADPGAVCKAGSCQLGAPMLAR